MIPIFTVAGYTLPISNPVCEYIGTMTAQLQEFNSIKYFVSYLQFQMEAPAKRGLLQELDFLFSVSSQRRKGKGTSGLQHQPSFSRAEHSGAPQTSNLSIRRTCHGNIYLVYGMACVPVNTSFGITCRHDESTKNR